MKFYIGGPPWEKGWTTLLSGIKKEYFFTRCVIANDHLYAIKMNIKPKSF